ncbi:hypothetical protein D3C87_1804430 [compost metagenome]
MILHRDVIAAANIDALVITVYGVKTGGKHQHIKLVLDAICRTNALGSDLVNRVGLDVDQRHIGPIEGGVVAAVAKRALGVQVAGH